jgi:hypothetical protein
MMIVYRGVESDVSDLLDGPQAKWKELFRCCEHGHGVFVSNPQPIQEEILRCCEQGDQVQVSILAGLAKTGDDAETIRKNITTAKAYAAAIKASFEKDAEDAKNVLLAKQEEEKKKRNDAKAKGYLQYAEPRLAYCKEMLNKREAEAAEMDAGIKLMGIPEQPSTSIGIAIRQERSALATTIESLKGQVNRWETEIGAIKSALNKEEKSTGTEKVC